VLVNVGFCKAVGVALGLEELSAKPPSRDPAEASSVER
jgi:hypothetical protein